MAASTAARPLRAPGAGKWLGSVSQSGMRMVSDPVHRQVTEPNSSALLNVSSIPVKLIEPHPWSDTVITVVADVPGRNDALSAVNSERSAEVPVYFPGP